MAEDHTLFNPGPLPLVFDNAGHVVDPLDRVAANPNGGVVKGLVAAGLLVDQGPTGNPDAPTTEDPDTAPDPEPEQVVVEDGD